MRGARRISLFLSILSVITLVHYYFNDLTSTRYGVAWLHPENPFQFHKYPQHSFDSDPDGITPEPNTLTSPSPIEDPVLLSPWAQETEYAAGIWVPRSPPYATWEDYKSTNQPGNGWFWSGCPLFNDSGIEDGEEKTRLQRERLKDLMNWVWQPVRGELVPFDAVEFVVRLLQSPGGLVMLGDSITRQHHDSLMTIMNKFDIHFGHMSPRINYTARYVLQRGAPMTKLIQERAGVPDSRLSRPFITSIQDHMILPEEDIRSISNAPESWVWPLKHHPHVENLFDMLENAVTPVEGEEDTVTKDSILMFSTGPHWSRSRLPIPNTGNYKKERATMIDIYSKMMDILVSRFSLLSRTSLIYRLSPAPHPQCERHTKPYPNLSAALVDDARIFELHTQGLDVHWRQIHAKWDWDLWNVYNKMWIERIGELSKEREDRLLVEGEDEKARWYFLDIAQMTLQRPEAHYQPGEDCLHYCLPTIYDDWTRFLYHRLFLLGEVGGPPGLEVVEGDKAAAMIEEGDI